jgi:glycerophosphoryl diester phosphodiesterase
VGPAFSAPLIIGHRGAAMRAPENTLAGFTVAKRLGASWVEFDVQATRDHCPVLLHDARLDRTTNGRGLVAEQTLAEIAKLDAGNWFAAEFRGERVPTLDAALALLDELNIGAMIEVKAAPGDGPRTMDAALAVLRTRALRIPVLLSSFDEAALAMARDERPDIERALIVKDVAPGWRARMERLGAAALHAGERDLAPATIASVAAAYPLRAYTVNAPARAKALLTAGVAAVFTDCPDVLISAVGHQFDRLVLTGLRGSLEK